MVTLNNGLNFFVHCKIVADLPLSVPPLHVGFTMVSGDTFPTRSAA